MIWNWKLRDAFGATLPVTAALPAPQPLPTADNEKLVVVFLMTSPVFSLTVVVFQVVVPVFFILTVTVAFWPGFSVDGTPE